MNPDLRIQSDEFWEEDDAESSGFIAYDSKVPQDDFEQPVPVLAQLLDGYKGQDPDLLKEIKAINARIEPSLNAHERTKLELTLRVRKQAITETSSSGYPQAPEVIELGWVVMARAIHEACFHPEVHVSRYGHYMNMATLIGGLGDEPRLCLNILRADAWREELRNEVYLSKAEQATREQYVLKIYQRIYRNLQFMYWEAGLPIGLESAQAMTRFDWQSPQFESIRHDKFAVLLELNHQNRAFELFASIESRSTILRQQRPIPQHANLPAWSACKPEFADRSFASHTKILIERQKQRAVAQTRYDWDEF